MSVFWDRQPQGNDHGPEERQVTRRLPPGESPVAEPNPPVTIPNRIHRLARTFAQAIHGNRSWPSLLPEDRCRQRRTFSCGPSSEFANSPSATRKSRPRHSERCHSTEVLASARDVNNPDRTGEQRLNPASSDPNRTCSDLTPCAPERRRFSASAG